MALLFVNFCILFVRLTKLYIRNPKSPTSPIRITLGILLTIILLNIVSSFGRPIVGIVWDWKFPNFEQNLTLIKEEIGELKEQKDALRDKMYGSKMTKYGSKTLSGERPWIQLAPLKDNLKFKSAEIESKKIRSKIDVLELKRWDLLSQKGSFVKPVMDVVFLIVFVMSIGPLVIWPLFVRFKKYRKSLNATQAAKMLAIKMGIDLSKIEGTGKPDSPKKPNKITVNDVRKAAPARRKK